MAKPLKFRYVHEIAGSFVLLVLILGIAAFIMTWRAQGWLERTYEITLVCPEEGSLGLTEGSTIEMPGFTTHSSSFSVLATNCKAAVLTLFYLLVPQKHGTCHDFFQSRLETTASGNGLRNDFMDFLFVDIGHISTKSKCQEMLHQRCGELLTFKF